MPNQLRAATGKKRFLDGYTDDPRIASDNHLCPPSQNCYVLKTGESVSRGGIMDTEWDLSEASKTAQSFHVKKYNVTFFSINGKVKYIEHDRGDAIVDTGLSLTATETTTFSEYAGDVYCTNQTDGLRQIHLFRLNDAAPDSGDSSVTIDQDGAARLLAFSDTSGNLRIRGTDEAYSSLVAGGLVTLTGTLSQNYANNDIAITVEDISSGRPKGRKLTFWKERMLVWGVVEDTNTYNALPVDDATNTVYMSKFASRSDIENVIDFDTSSTADIVQIGFGGHITEVVATRDYIYYFTDSTVHYSTIGDINVSTGATGVRLLSDIYGAFEDCVADLGNGRIAFLTGDNRIISIDISTESGAAVVFPNESFDIPYQNTLLKLDDDQTGFFYYSPAERVLFCHVDIDSERVILPYDNTIRAWHPPIRNWNFSSMFVKNGVTYATDGTDDTIYSINEGQQDDDVDFETIIATRIFEDEDGRTLLEWDNVGISGRVSENAEVLVEHISGEGTPQGKDLDKSEIAFSLENGLGTAKLGNKSLASGNPMPLGNYDENMAIPTTWSTSYQIVVSSTGVFTLQSYSINKESFLTLV